MKEKIKHIKDGTSQNKRDLPALKENYFNVNEMKFEDLIAYAVDFSKYVNYYNINNEINGSWEKFFYVDEAVILALIIQIDTVGIEKEFLQASRFSFSEKENYNIIVELIYDLILQINNWFFELNTFNFESENNFQKEMSGLICNKLTGRLKDFYQLILELIEHKKVEFDLSRFDLFDIIWELKDLEINDNENEKKYLNKTDINNQLMRVFFSFLNSINYLKKIAPVYLKESLKSQDHNSNITLFLAFLKLFQYAQEKANNFTEKHFNFYYFDILNIEPDKYIPDKIYFTFDIDENFEMVCIKKGTEIIGEKDENNKELVYITDTDLFVTKTKITQLKTLFFRRNNLIFPENSLDMVTVIMENEIPLFEEIDFSENSDLTVYPLFGDNRPSVSKRNKGRISTLGFAIADEILYLKEGDRTITLCLKFTEKSFSSLKKYFTHFTKILQTSPEEIVIKSVDNIFRVYVTIADDWFEIENYQVGLNYLDTEFKDNSINIQITLDKEDFAIDRYNKDIHGNNFDIDIPVIKFLIHENTYIYPYTLLKDLEVEEVEIKVRAEGVKDIYLQNNLGQIDPSGQFQPFGVLPKVGSYFIFSNFEMMYKNITNLSLEIEWGDLPNTKNGFNEYYNGYDFEIEDSSFEIKVLFLNKGKWIPSTETNCQKFHLFDSLTVKNDWGKIVGRYVDKYKNFDDIKLTDFCSKKRKIDVDNFKFDYSIRSGFIKFELSAPENAFGHQVYPDQLSKVTLDNAKLKKKKPVPKQPYTPVINSISINYEASSVISNDNVKKKKSLLHIHPFGYENVFPNNSKQLKTLLPQYNDNGNLFIALTDVVTPTIVTLYFNLLEDSVIASELDTPEILWYYLKDNKWIEFKSVDVLYDSTNGFLTSGIVSLNLSTEINKNNTIMSNEYFWIRVNANHNFNAICSLVSVKTQAVRATWKNEKNSLTHLKTGLPANGIWNFRNNIAGISNIKQPEKSFGGKLPENTERLKRRIGERLKHKNRATTAWDYERLILEKFPEIFKVKCFSNMTSQKKIAPGNILIVVIPYLKERQKTSFYEPMAGNPLLIIIKQFITSLASGFANIEVRNPAYEKVQVRFTVKFKNKIAGGYYIKKLNDELVEFLSPWNTKGEREPRFGAGVKTSNVLAFLQKKEYVEFITNFSMLHITHNRKNYYHLYDTEKLKKNLNKNIELELKSVQEIKPTRPWAVLVSAKSHYIEVINDIGLIEAEQTGIDELELGESFIIE